MTVEGLAAADKAFDEAQVKVFASSHSCLPVLQSFARDRVLINNGAAGMPNFSGLPFGLISRIATTPSPHRALYGMVRDGVHIDAIPIDYHGEDFLGRFLARWPPGSAAHMSYFERITRGPDYSLAQAALPRPNDVVGHPCRA